MMRMFNKVVLVLLVLVLSGCSLGVLDPKGSIGHAERNLIFLATGLMLLVVVPTNCLVLWFAWKYRASNKAAIYAPKWDHSVKIEWVIWGIPIVIVAILTGFIWVSTHALDPYKSLKLEGKPLRVEVVSMRWKWLFIYPEEGIATVNELVIPKDREVAFHITSSDTMNSFFIPQLGSQIYSMTGMRTKLHLVANEVGNYKGFSSNISGAGFAQMHFDTIVKQDEDAFDAWVAIVRQSDKTLTAASYDTLAEPDKPDEHHHYSYYPVTYYGKVTPGLFESKLMVYMAAMAGNKYMDMGGMSMGGMEGQGMDMQGKPMHMQGKPMHMQGKPMHMQGKPMDMQGKSMDMQGKSMDMQGKSMDMQGKPMHMQQGKSTNMAENPMHMEEGGKSMNMKGDYKGAPGR